MASGIRAARRVAEGAMTYSVPRAETGGIWPGASSAPGSVMGWRRKKRLPANTATGLSLVRMDPDMSLEVAGSCHCRTSPAESVYVAVTPWGAAGEGARAG